MTNLRMINILTNSKTMWKKVSEYVKWEKLKIPSMIITNEKIERSPGKLATIFANSFKK